MQNRLKIAISVTGFIEWTGGINFLKGIIDLLLNNDNDFYLLLPSFSLKNYPKFLVKNFKSLLKLYNQIFPAKENPEMEELFKEFKGKVKFVYHNGNIVKAINKIKPDIIYPTWDKIYNKCKIPQIAYLYDCQHRYFPEYFKKHSIESRDKYFQSVVDNYKAIIVGSLDAKNDLIKFYGAKPEQVFSIFGSPLLDKNYLDEIKTDVIEKYQLPKKYFMVCSQFWKHKSHITVIEAVKQLKDNGIDTCVVCTGKTDDYRNPEYFGELQQKIKEWDLENNIKILGLIDKPEQVELIKKSVAVIQPSLYEGGAGAGGVGESLSLGKPIIMSDIPINKEYSKFNNIFYFEAKNADSLAKNMKIVLNTVFKKYTNDELKQMSDKNRQKEIEKIYAPVYALLNK